MAEIKIQKNRSGVRTEGGCVVCPVCDKAHTQVRGEYSKPSDAVAYLMACQCVPCGSAFYLVIETGAPLKLYVEFCSFVVDEEEQRNESKTS